MLRIVILDNEPIDELILILKRRGFTVAYFTTSNKIFDYIEKNLWDIDMVLIDELLGADSTEYSTGTELGKAINTAFNFIPCIMFTGHAYSIEKSIEILAECGFCYFFNKNQLTRDTKNQLLKISNLPIFTTKWKLRKAELERELQAYIQSLLPPQIKLIEQEILKGKDADWNKAAFKVYLKNGEYNFEQLLRTPNTALNLTDVNEQIKKLLKKSTKNYKFAGDWEKEDKGIKEQLEIYWNLPTEEYKRLKTQIDYKSLDYLLNVLFIYDKMEEDSSKEEDILSLNARNRKILVTNNCKNSKNGWGHFIDKLIGRRVALGFNEIIGFVQDNNFEKKHLAALLRQGNTNTNKILRTGKEKGKIEDFKPTTVFSTHLGLPTNQSTGFFDLEANNILFEEEQWLETFGKAAKELRTMLTHAPVPKLQTGYLTPEEGFIDLTELKDYISELLIKSKNDYENMKKHLNDKANNYSSFTTLLLKELTQ